MTYLFLKYLSLHDRLGQLLLGSHFRELLAGNVVKFAHIEVLKRDDGAILTSTMFICVRIGGWSINFYKDGFKSCCNLQIKKISFSVDFFKWLRSHLFLTSQRIFCKIERVVFCVPLSGFKHVELVLSLEPSKPYIFIYDSVRD
jgi:hypothetical protein